DAEEAGVDEVDPSDLDTPVTRGAPLRRIHAVERRLRGRTYPRDDRLGTQAPQRAGAGVLVQVELHDVVRAHAGLETVRLDGAAQQDAGDDEQQRADADLGHHEGSAQAPRAKRGLEV